tara:strand:- start:8597 stop:8890 length:294 start_codon:yes stop_codon:yes gene_type:complete
MLKQFDRWKMTQAEIQVGMLMLKGLSHQEIADVRATSERTIREQARAVYRKSGLTGRSELSAFFQKIFCHRMKVFERAIKNQRQALVFRIKLKINLA